MGMGTKFRNAKAGGQPCVIISLPWFTDYSLVVDQLVILVIPAVQLADLLADLLGGMLCRQLSHGLEVNLTA